MRNRKKLPIGIDSFEKIIRHNFYYVDKTEMITELLHNWGEVNLFTRPRRFGKSLNMNMLQSFLEIGCDKSLFNGLKVSREKELCEEYMGKFPVISLTLKNVEGLNFESARKSLKNTLGMEAWRLSALAESSRLTEEEKNSYKALTVVDDHGDFKMSDATMEKALLILTVLLEKHYGKKAVLFGRCIPIIRSLVSVPAGMAEMKLSVFLFYTTIGSTVWNILLVSLGAALGASWEKILFYLDRYSGAVRLLLLLGSGTVLVRMFRRRKNR